jgi:carboxypeptidase Q
MIRTIASICILLAGFAVAGAVHAQPSTAPALVGQWNFQSATGTTSDNGVTVDIISKGVLTITQTHSGLDATIAWLDERGQVTSTRKANGSFSADGAIFSHQGKRTATGRGGKETSTAVKISYTLQAKGDVLSGLRLVETDEDEPKPVTGTRVTASNPTKAAAPLAVQDKAPESAPERGPSTPAEQARVVQMALDAEKNPQQVQARDGEWLNTWVDEIPDLTFNSSALFNWLGAVAKGDTREAIKFQYKASVMAFQIKNPKQAELQSANDLAGLAGVLRAYEVLVAKNANYRSAKLDMALKACTQGELPALLKAVAGRDPD